jgi:general transcription factor IIIA
MSNRARDHREKNSHPNGRTPICNWINSGCDKRIQNSNHLFNHIRFEHELKPVLSAKRYNINPLWRGPRIAGSVLRRCSVCGDDFLELSTHTRRSPCGSNHKCPVCDLRFNDSHQLEAHIKRHDAHREIFHCPKKDCDKQYATKQGLNEHIQHIHQEKKRICPYCGKAFSFFGVNFSRHVKKHLGQDSKEQVHRCTYKGCTKEYHTSSGLKVHINSCHLRVMFQCASMDVAPCSIKTLVGSSTATVYMKGLKERTSYVPE